MTVLVTGGAGFIGSNFVHAWLAQHDEVLVNLDKLTYAGNLRNLRALAGDRRHHFVQGDIGDTTLVSQLLATHQPRAVLHFAAESHVDRSIHGPMVFKKLPPCAPTTQELRKMKKVPACAITCASPSRLLRP